jgi:hypothetical protein
LADGLHKKAAGGVATCGDGLVQSLSQPQARARRPKVKKEIPATKGVVHLLTAAIHHASLAKPPAPSSAGMVAGAIGNGGCRWRRLGICRIVEWDSAGREASVSPSLRLVFRHPPIFAPPQERRLALARANPYHTKP